MQRVSTGNPSSGRVSAGAGTGAHGSRNPIPDRPRLLARPRRSYGPARRTIRGGRTNMGKGKWLVALAGCLAANGAWAENGGEMQITPYGGYSHMRIEGAHLPSREADRFDLLLGGVTVGYKTPIGIVIEAGTSNAFHDQWFDDDEDF